MDEKRETILNFENILSGSFSHSVNSSSAPKNASGTAWILLLLLTAPVERNLRHAVVERDLLKAHENGEELCTRIVRDASSSLFMGAHRKKSLVSSREHSSKENIQKRKFFTFLLYFESHLTESRFLFFFMRLVPMFSRDCWDAHVISRLAYLWPSRDCCLGGGW